MKKKLGNGFYSLIFFIILIVYFTFSSIDTIDTYLNIDENISSTQINLDRATNELIAIKQKIQKIKDENSKKNEQVVDIKTIEDKIKIQINAFNIISKEIKINFNSLQKQDKYLDAFKAEFDLVLSPSTEQIEIAKVLDFLGLYGVVESFLGNKVVVYVTLKNHSEPKEEIKEEPKIENKEEIANLINMVEKRKEMNEKNEKKDIATNENIKVEEIKEIENKEIIEINSSSDSLEKRFLDANPKKYSILLLADDDKSYIINLMTQNHIKQDVDYLILTKPAKVKYRHRVIYGLYDTQEEANSAINNLPKVFKINKPKIIQIKETQELYKKSKLSGDTK